jgi:hypothetical protein
MTRNLRALDTIRHARKNRTPACSIMYKTECSVPELAGLSFPASWSRTTGLDLFEGLSASGEFSHDGVDGCGPNEGSGSIIPGGEKLVDGGNQVFDAQERSAADSLVGKLAEPPFN